MLLLILLLALSGLVTWACAAAGLSGWALVLIFLGTYVLLHPLWLLAFCPFTLSIPLDKPVEKQSRACRFCCNMSARLLCLYGGVRPRIRGKEKIPAGPFLYVSNHRSLFDPLMVMGSLSEYNISFIAKPSVMKIPMVRRIAYAAGYMGIDRENDRKALKTILAAADYLKRGLCSVGIYPEGHRTRDGQMLPFHPGSFKIAQRGNAPVVLACVRGTEKLRKGAFLHPHLCELEILECIPAEQVKAMSTQELSDHCRGLILQRLAEKEGESA